MGNLLDCFTHNKKPIEPAVDYGHFVCKSLKTPSLWQYPTGTTCEGMLVAGEFAGKCTFKFTNGNTFETVIRNNKCTGMIQYM